MRSFVREVPLSVVGVAVAVLIAIAIGPALARWTRTRKPVAMLLVVGFGLVLSATLTPTAEALDGIASSGVCDLSRIGLLSLNELLSVNSWSLNVLLFLPLGIAVGLLPPIRTSGFVALLAILLPFAVETIQLVLPVLGRSCQSADIFDNLTGLAIGAAVGIVARHTIAR